MTDNYKDTTLDQLIRIAEIERKGGDELEVQTAILSVLDGRTPEDLMRLPIAEYAALSAKKRYLDAPFPKGDPKAIQRIGGLHLVPSASAGMMTVSQFVDFQELSKRGAEATVDILAAFYVPKGCKYGETDPARGGYDIDAVKTAIRSISAPDAVAAYAFFLTSFAKSLRDTLFYSELRAKRIRDPEKRAEVLNQISRAKKILSSANGDGSTR